MSYGFRGTPNLKGRPRSVLAGMVVGMLTVVEPSGKGPDGSVLWLCTCSCGGTTNARAYQLAGGHVKSCGCLRGKYRRNQAVQQRRARVRELERQISQLRSEIEALEAA